MKLLLITAVKEFEKDIKLMLKKVGVKSFSYKEVKGYKDNSEDALEANWFAANEQEMESVLFYVFVNEEKINDLFEMVNGFNVKQETVSHIHLAVLGVEKSN